MCAIAAGLAACGHAEMKSASTPTTAVRMSAITPTLADHSHIPHHPALISERITVTVK